MSNNYTANATTVANGPVLSMTDVSGSSYPTTGLAQNVVHYAAIDTSTQPGPVTKANPTYVRLSDGTNVSPTLDAAARAGYVYVTNGTQTQPTMDAAGRAGFVKVTDGTNTQPTGDAVGRKIFVALTNGTTVQGVGVGTESFVSTGGSATAAVTAGVGTAASVVKGSPGRLCRVTVTTLGTAAMSFYDDASAATGTVLFTIPASAAVGTVYDLQMPAAVGIVAGKVNNSPAVTVSYY